VVVEELHLHVPDADELAEQHQFVAQGRVRAAGAQQGKDGEVGTCRH
jgi:hypothetical protein